jgi:ABC-2 type transport system permease protein
MRPVWIILRRELTAFFDSLIAYVVLAVFLVGVGLFFWLFNGNVLQSGTASLETLFVMAPWFFLFLIPAITMRSFAEEFKTGTIEFLSTKPITTWQVLLGKYLAATVLVAFALLPTLFYYASVEFLADGQWLAGRAVADSGAIWGAYLGLLGIGAVFCAIGVFSSTLTSNQIVAFILGAFLCFVLYIVFDYLAELPLLNSVKDAVLRMGIAEHYRSISRGVVDTRDVVYYLTVIAIFLLLGKTVLDSRKR